MRAAALFGVVPFCDGVLIDQAHVANELRDPQGLHQWVAAVDSISDSPATLKTLDFQICLLFYCKL